MARVTQGRQDEIRQSDEYDDTLAAGAHLETDGTDIQYDINALRSLRKQDQGVAHWYDPGTGGGGGGGTGYGGVVVSATLASTGPGAGVIPTQRTYEDGTVVDYTYQADGWTLDTMAVTKPGQATVTYQAQYAASGVRSHWLPL